MPKIWLGLNLNLLCANVNSTEAHFEKSKFGFWWCFEAWAGCHNLSPYHRQALGKKFIAFCSQIAALHCESLRSRSCCVCVFFSMVSCLGGKKKNRLYSDVKVRLPDRPFSVNCGALKAFENLISVIRKKKYIFFTVCQIVHLTGLRIPTLFKSHSH